MTTQLLSKLSQPTWTVMEYGWYPLVVLISTPYFVHTLGAADYGHWMLLTATVAFGGILNAGTSAAVIKEVAAGCGGHGGTKVEGTVRSALAIAITSGGVFAAIVALVFTFFGQTLFARMGDQSLVLLTGIAAAGLGWMEQVENVFVSALKGAELFGRAAGIEMAGRTIQIIAAVIGITVWPSLAAVYISLIVIGILRLAVKARAVRRSLGLSSLRPVSVGTQQLLEYARWGWMQGAGGVLFSVADRMLIGSVLGAASLTHYSVATQLAQQIHGLSAAAFSVVAPKVSRCMTLNDGASLRYIAKIAIRANYLASSALALALWFFGKSILSVWLGESVAEASAQVLRYLTVAYWLLAINVAPHFVMLGIGKIRVLSITNLAAGVASLVAMVALAHSFGLIGVALARILYGAVILLNLLPLAEYFRRTGSAPPSQTRRIRLADSI